MQHPARVLVLLGELAQRRQDADVVELVADVGHKRNDQALLVKRIEDFRGANELHSFSVPLLLRRCRRLGERKGCDSETRTRKLPIISRGRAGRRLIFGARLVGPVRGFGGTPQPVMRTRQRGWVPADLLDAREVRPRRGGVAEETQRNPPRHEMAFDARVFFYRVGSVAHHQIRGTRIAGIKEVAG